MSPSKRRDIASMGGAAIIKRYGRKHMVALANKSVRLRRKAERAKQPGPRRVW